MRSFIEACGNTGSSMGRENFACLSTPMKVISSVGFSMDEEHSKSVLWSMWDSSYRIGLKERVLLG